MRRMGFLAIAAIVLFAGCSGSVEIGPVPTITPRPTATPAPVLTPTPVVTGPGENDTEEASVYETKKFQEYYEKENKLPQLSVAYADLFTVGIDALQIDTTDARRQAVIKEQFNTISCKTDLSPNVLMDYEASAASGDLTRIALDFSGADVILKFAQENKIPVRGPRLITNETPEWAFTKDFSEAQVTTVVGEDGTETTEIEYASADVIKARMENYIKDVITYCNTNYPGLVVSWEVLDDVISSGEKHELGYRSSSYWYQGIGEEYITEACRIARQYATPEQKLIITQSDLSSKATLNPSIALFEKLKADKLIDGVGIQAHFTPTSPNVFDMEDMFKKVHETGLELHITEFYVDSNEGAQGDLEKTPEELLTRVTKRYKNVMTAFVNMEQKKSFEIASLTFEGLTNDTSSLNEPKEYLDTTTGEAAFGVRVESYPYLFDKDLNVMSTFFAALGDVTIKGY